MNALIVVLLCGVGLVTFVAIYLLREIRDIIKVIKPSLGEMSTAMVSLSSSGRITNSLDGIDRRLMRIERIAQSVDEIKNRICMLEEVEHNNADYNKASAKRIAEINEYAKVMRKNVDRIEDILIEVTNMIESAIGGERVDTERAKIIYEQIAPMVNEQNMTYAAIAKKLGVKKDELAAIMKVYGEQKELTEVK